MTTPTETPKTDAVIRSDTGDSGLFRDLAVLSRRLEQELAASNAEVERLRGQLIRAVEIAEQSVMFHPSISRYERRAELNEIKKTPFRPESWQLLRLID